MQNHHPSTTAQLRDDIDSGRTGSKVAATDPAAAPLGTDDEAGGSAPSTDRIEMARSAERKIGTAAKRKETSSAAAKNKEDQAEMQRGSNAPYAKEDHMNQELEKQVEDRRLKERASE